MHSFPIYFLFAEKSVDLCAPVVCDIFLLLLHTCRRQVAEGRERCTSAGKMGWTALNL